MVSKELLGFVDQCQVLAGRLSCGDVDANGEAVKATLRSVPRLTVAAEQLVLDAVLRQFLLGVARLSVTRRGVCSRSSSPLGRKPAYSLPQGAAVRGDCTGLAKVALQETIRLHSDSDFTMHRLAQT